MSTVYVVTAEIQHPYETQRYNEVIGVARSLEGAKQLKYKAFERGEVCDVDIETAELVG